MVTYGKCSISKKSAFRAENEDRLLQSGIFYAISDGAGGSGILCGEWGELALSRLVEKPISSFLDFTLWLGAFVDEFVEQYEQLITEDSFQLRKFYEEGSACTIAALWLEGSQSHWMTYGDAHVFHITEDTFESAPFQAREEFSRGTYLLNWNSMPDPEGFRAGTFKLEESSVLLLATDEVSKHIFYLRDSSKDFRQSLQQLLLAIKDEDTFRRYIAVHPDIGEDDYTLIYIKV